MEVSDNGKRRYKVNTGRTYGYKCRWFQPGFAGTVTGKVVYQDLDGCLALCTKINRRWKKHVTQWPVKYALNETKVAIRELEDLRHILFPERSPLEPAEQPILAGMADSR